MSTQRTYQTLWLGDESWSTEVTEDGAQVVLQNNTTATQFLPMRRHNVELLRELVRCVWQNINNADGLKREYSARRGNVLPEADVLFTTTGDEFASLEVTTDETVWCLDSITEFDLSEWVKHCDAIIADFDRMPPGRCHH